MITDQPSQIARREIDLKLERLARSIGTTQSRLKPDMLALIDDAYLHLCALNSPPALTPASEHALGQAMLAITTYNLPKFLRYMQAALDFPDQHPPTSPRTKPLKPQCDKLLMKLRQRSSKP